MKRTTLTIVAVTAAVSMLSFAAFAGTDTYAGYEKFKDLLKNEANTEEHGQGVGSITIIDNDETILTASGEFAGDKEMKEGYGNMFIKSNQVEKSLEVYGQDEMIYVVDGDDIYKSSHDEDDYEGHRGKRGMKNKEDFDRDGKFDKKAEAVLDIFMDDVKDDFTVEGDNIVFELTKEEMPALLNIMMSEEHEKEGRMKHDMTDEELANYPLAQEMKTIKESLPQLTEKEAEYIKIVLIVEDDTIKGIETNIIVNGLDENGESHVVEVQTEFNKAENPLEIKTLEITDETVYEIEDRD